jgi:non-specific serine/threonine protein kinase/serine/threonine-protein kinase
MTLDRWEQVKELLHKVMQLAPGQRSLFLNEHCSSVGGLRAEVESLLLVAEDVPAGFLQSAPPASELAGNHELQSTPRFAVLGERFGPYKTVRLLGEGGMGTVYLAEQRQPIRRQVALKVIKLGMNTREVLARFDSERQALALMDHPNIAHVFDAGVSERGQPYFAMEYVSGVPINEYCDKNRLTNRERIELFLQVCQAVQHAHQKGVIHRYQAF